MANYIKSNIICQAYLHLDMPLPDEEILENLRESLHAYVDQRANFFLENKVEAAVTLTEGSIIEHLTIIGSIYALIHQYPKFREGVQMIFSDIKRLTEAMSLEAQFITGAKNNSVVHSEARTGLIGLLKALLDKIQNIRDSYGMVRISTLTRRLNSCLNDTVKILDSLPEMRDQRYIAVNIRDIIFELPDSPPQKPKLDRPEPNALRDFQTARASCLSFLEDYELL